MKIKKIIGTIFGATVTLCFVLTGCDNGTTSDANPPAVPKTIVVTGFPVSSHSGKVAVITLLPSLIREEVAAVGGAPISSSRLTIPLKTDETLSTDWRGSGEYIVLLMVGDPDGTINQVFIYSEGRPVTGDTINFPKYSITEAASTISFGSFYDITALAKAKGWI
jgi:hypothetical protein